MLKKAFFSVFAAALVFGFAGAVFASSHGTGAGTPGTGVTLVNPLGEDTTLVDIANRIIDFLFTIAIPLTAILVLVGGFQMITAGGNPENFSKGKKTILYAAIGFAVVLLSKGVVGLIQNLVGAQ